MSDPSASALLFLCNTGGLLPLCFTALRVHADQKRTLQASPPLVSKHKLEHILNFAEVTRCLIDAMQHAHYITTSMLHVTVCVLLTITVLFNMIATALSASAEDD